MTKEFCLEKGTVHHFYTQWGQHAHMTILQNYEDEDVVTYRLQTVEGHDSESTGPADVIQVMLQGSMKYPGLAEPKLSRQRVFDYHSDPAHGWLKVRQDDLIALGVANDISAYSYRRAQYAYLEEDRDVTIFENAYHEATGRTLKFKNRFADKRSRIRDYDCYVSPITGQSYHDPD